MALSTAALTLLLAVAGCELTNPFEDAKLLLDVPAAPTQVTVRFVDASTGEELTNVPLTLRFSGPQAALVVDETRQPLTQTTLPAEPGAPSAYNFGLTRPPSQNAPADVRLEASAPGFLTTSLPLALADTTTTVLMPLVRLSALPDGVGAGAGSGTATSAGLTAPLTVNTPETPTTNLQATIAIPTGTGLQNARGEPLSGAVTATVVAFDPRHDEAAVAFPGGFTDIVAANQPAGTDPGGTFLTAGFTAVEMQAGGQAVRRFSQPISVSIEVPQGTINPTTDAPVQNGDTIPIYSFETDTGTWTFERNGTAVGPDAQGNFKVTFPTTHLSYYNLDWYSSATCRSATFRVNLPAGANPLLYEGRLYLTRGNRLLKTFALDNTSQVVFYGAPRGLASRLDFYARGSTARLHTVTTPNLCTGGTISVPGTPLQTVTVEFDIAVTLDGQPAEIRPTMTVYVKDRSSGVWMYPFVDRGRTTISGLVLGRSYIVYVYYDGRYYNQEVTLSASSLSATGPNRYTARVRIRSGG